MGTLTNKLIDETYEGLIKTADEGPIDGTDKRLQDGLGNNLPVAASTNGMIYYGNQDFTNATVTGISSGGAIVAATIPFTSSTTVQQNQIVGQVGIPGGTFQNDDALMLKGNLGYRFDTNPVDSGTVRIYLGPSPSYDPTVNKPLGYQQIFISAGDSFMLPVSKTLSIKNDTFFAVGQTYSGSKTTNTPDVEFYDRDFPTSGQLTFEGIEEIDWSQDQFLSVVFDVNNSGDRATTYALSLTKINQ